MQRAVIYCRVSTVKNPGQAISSQLTICRDYCRRWKLDVVAEYCDEGFSGRKLDRPGLANLMASALSAERPYDVIVVMDKARFLDDASAFDSQEDLLAQVGVSIRPVAWEKVHIPTEVDTERAYMFVPAGFIPEGEEVLIA